VSRPNTTNTVSEGSGRFDCAPVTIVVSNYRDTENLSRCLVSLRNALTPPFEVVVADCMTQGIHQLVSRELPGAKVIHFDQDLGAAHARNAGASAASPCTQYIAFLDNDITVSAGWLDALVHAARLHPDGGAFQSLVMLASNPDLVNTEGGVANYLLFGWPGGFGKKPRARGGVYRIDFASGCAVLVSKEAWRRANGLDSSFFIYCDDLDLSVRLRMLGYRSYLVSDSVVYHDYEFEVTPRRMFYLQRNRWFTLMKIMSARNLLRLLPMLCLTEVGIFMHSLRHNWIDGYARAWLDVVEEMHELRVKQRKLRMQAKITDTQLLRELSTGFGFSGLRNGWLMRFLDAVLSGYGRAFVTGSGLV